MSCRSGLPREIPYRQQSLSAFGRGAKSGPHDAVHVRDLGMQAAPDEAVLKHARISDQVLISADTDFGGLLSRSRAGRPSVILIRRLIGRRAAEQATIILANLDRVAEDLTAGAMVVIHQDTLRVRRLPI